MSWRDAEVRYSPTPQAAPLFSVCIMHASVAIRRANKATATELAASVPAIYEASGHKFNISVSTASALSKHERDQIWSLFEENMYDFYNTSSFGWNPQSKKLEMFDPQSRFIIARVDGGASASVPDSVDICAYTLFRFDREEYQNVVYCYELQVSKHVRRYGLGKWLTLKLVDIGAEWGMEKVVLTVFKANQSALSFYTSVGFLTDESSPDHPANSGDQATDTGDYSILSIPILAS